jgi:hypothetical protein
MYKLNKASEENAMRNFKIERDEDMLYMSFDVNEEHFGVMVESVGMNVARGNNGNDVGEYWDGDLAVNWSTVGLTNDETARTMGTLLLRNLNSKDDVTEVMGQFYWEHGFDERLAELLVEVGFSAKAAYDVSGSEWGMQDEGRASYDAYMIADEIRAMESVYA